VRNIKNRRWLAKVESAITLDSTIESEKEREEKKKTFSLVVALIP
jgi:hypothetical protein